MKILNISGGGTKIGGLFGVAEALMNIRKVQFDVISGVSAGAILAVPLAIGKFQQVRELVLDYSMHDFFKNAPVTEDGKIKASAIFRIVRGCLGLGDQSKLKETLSKIVTRRDFSKYVNGSEFPVCWLGVVDLYTGEKEYYNCKELLYEEYLEIVLASSSIPVFSDPVRFRGKLLVDGGVRDHIGSVEMLEKYKKATDVYSIFSRPMDYKAIDIAWKPKNLLSILARTIDIMNIEISKSDESETDLICLERGINHNKYYLPRIMKSVYDVDPERLYAIYEAGHDEGLKGGYNRYLF